MDANNNIANINFREFISAKEKSWGLDFVNISLQKYPHFISQISKKVTEISSRDKLAPSSAKMADLLRKISIDLEMNGLSVA